VPKEVKEELDRGIMMARISDSSTYSPEAMKNKGIN